ncbi:steroid C27-monooxygenase [Mycobacterium avium MAV_120709_2344]|nr:steroid C27-monooxygenase [Mycobacterium avium MAV_120709_2344]
MRSDIFSSQQDCAIPVWPKEMTREQIDLQRNVMLNMDAPHHTRLRKIISRGFTPRAVGRLRDELDARAQNIAKTAAAAGAGDFVEQVSCELPLQAIAGLLGVPQEDRDKIFRWSNEMTGNEDPEYAHIDPAMSSAELIMYAMKMAEERAKNPGDDIVTQLIQADLDGEKLSDDEFGFFVVMLAVAGNETTRNSITHGMIAFADNPTSGSCSRRSARRPRRTKSCAGQRQSPRSSAPRSRITSCPGADQEGPAGGDVLPLGELRRRGLRGSAPLQHLAKPQPARRFWRYGCALLHRRQPGPDDHQPDLQRRGRPHAGPQAAVGARAVAVGLAQRHQALAGRLHRQVPGGTLIWRQKRRWTSTSVRHNRRSPTSSRRCWTAN